MSARVVRNGEGVEWNVMGDVVRVILSQDETGGGMSVVQQSVKPGSGIPLHVNTREDEVFQVLEGELEFQIGDGTVVAEPGTTIYAPRHTPHGFRAAGSAPALLQITMTPAAWKDGRGNQPFADAAERGGGWSDLRTVWGEVSDSFAGRPLRPLEPNGGCCSATASSRVA